MIFARENISRLLDASGGNAQGVGDNGNGAEGHGQGADHGIEVAQRGQGYAKDVVEKSPKQVLPDGADCFSRQDNGLGDAVQVAQAATCAAFCSGNTSATNSSTPACCATAAAALG